MKHLLFTLISFTISITVLAQGLPIDLKEELKNELTRISLEDENIGVSFSVMFNNENHIDISAGYADKESGRLLTTEDRLLAGSTGKLFFASVILKLVENGKLDLEEKLLSYIPNEDWYKSFPNYKEITIKNLLNHTSGLPRHLFQKEFIDKFSNFPNIPIDPREAILTIKNMKAVHPCGKGWAYSDTNFILLAIAVEKIMDKSMYQLIEEYVTIPLALSNSESLTKRKYKHIASGYIGKSNPFKLPLKTIENGELIYDASFEWAGGGFISTPHDLAKLLKYIHESDFLNKKTKNEMCSAVNSNTGKKSYSGYGLGSFVYNKMNETRYGHSGYFPGYATHVEYSPSRQYSLAIQINYDQNYSKLQQYCYELEQIIIKYMNKFDENGILANFKKQEKCWNQASLECYMEAYSPTGDIQTISKVGTTTGYEDILKNYKTYFPENKMGTLFFDEINYRRLSNDLYFTTGQFNLKFDDRPDLVKGWFSVILKKIQGSWYIITDHS